LDGENRLNRFKFDPFFEKTEEEWTEIKKEILGDEIITNLQSRHTIEAELAELEEQNEENEEEKILDFTEQDLTNLRRTIYLVIMNSVDFEACAMKILKLNIGEGHEFEVCNMILDCCKEQRTYLKFFGLLGERFCNLGEVY
jgi:pre-mRNA-splicing factor CWC22